MYVAVKGGEKAIRNAHAYLAHERRGDTAVAELSVDQIRTQLSLAVDRVMAEASLYDPELAALALKQARGDVIEAVFLLRAYRTTLPRFGASEPVDSTAMRLRRRISAAFKDLPGGQVLGPTFDYTHRLLDFSLLEEGANPGSPERAEDAGDGMAPRVSDLAGMDRLMEAAGVSEADDALPVGDLTRAPLNLPAGRDIRLQNLARADEGFLLAMGYSTQRGFRGSGGHPFAGEIRIGAVEVELVPEELGFAVCIGELQLTEAEILFLYDGSEDVPPQFTRGYGLTFGSNERKTIAMALVDRALRSREMGEEIVAPAQDEEFMLYHSDNVEATGFVEHLKLPHHVDFQSELEILRRLRCEWEARKHRREEQLRSAKGAA
ncbi:carbon-phosphorus lyase complex subunit PhnI [Oleidesulfovibrio sp.]|uniref:carbon-phosphorus lyase complex subunit PhnI n=1 Tax=Oleidesulfovibrio sp. TaxID=2909707 RepID=UPI003A875855